ncbi:MAG: DoxX family protein [Sandaracinaceae bacterium]|nr:DoxX family protein [Sandaracinaceae bacterium]
MTERTTSGSEPTPISIALLLLRIAAGAMMMVHGGSKLSGWGEMSADFPDPLGVGHATSLALAIFGELVCAAALIPGVLTRLAAIPYTFTMVVAGVIVHAEDPWSRKELAMLYLVCGLVIAIAGPGRFSIDAQLAPKLKWGKYLVS